MQDSLNNWYECPRNHDGKLDIQFYEVLMPYGKDTKSNLLTPSVKNPSDYNWLELVQKNLAWSGVDIIKAYNVKDHRDAVIYTGAWKETETIIHNS